MTAGGVALPRAAAGLRRMGLERKITFLVLALLLGLLVLTVSTLWYRAAEALERQIGTRALDIARTVAATPAIADSLYTRDPIPVVAPLAERVRRLVGADFVVVLDQSGTRLSHPVPEWVGKATASLDYGPALYEGAAYYTRIREADETALAGIAPIYGRDGEILGLVSVGFRVQDVRLLTWRFGREAALIAAAALLLGSLGAARLARGIKREIFGLEPPQIARIVEERDAVLAAIREGILAIDAEGRITVCNREAQRLMDLEESPVGRHVGEILPGCRMLRVLETGEPEYDQEMLLGDAEVVANQVPVHIGGRIAGVVASFRDRSEIRRIARELTDVRRYSEALRAQTHEFTNRLHTIAGLIQLGAADEALEFIMRTEEQHQRLLDQLARAVPDTTVAALILGKYNRAAELGVRLELDPASRLTRAPERLGRSLLVTVLGNLIENAVEAVQNLPEERRWVRVRLDDTGPAAVLEVSDGGPGVAPALREAIFAEGFSTRSESPGHRGLGLALVRRRVSQVGGDVTVSEAEGGGARFVVRLPCGDGEGGRRDDPGARRGR